MYSLSTSFWIVPVSCVAGDALLLGDQLVEQQQQRGRGVDGHRRGHLVQRDAVEQDPHVVDRVDRHADLADLAVGDRVRRSRSPSGSAGRRPRDSPLGAVGDQLVVALVGLLGRAEPGVLPHRPRPAGVHRRVDAAGERVAAGLAELVGRIPAGQVVRAVHRLDRQPRLCLASHAAEVTARAVLRAESRTSARFGTENAGPSLRSIRAHHPRRHAVPRPRRHVVVGGAPHHRRPGLLLPVRPRAGHRAGPGLARGLRRGHRDLQEPDRQPARGRPGRRRAVPRAQRPAGHRDRLLGEGPALPAADALGRRRPLGDRADARLLLADDGSTPCETLFGSTP